MTQLFLFSDLECYTTYDKGASYNGTVTQTRKGIQCLNWGTVTNNSPHYFENHNYCRNPFNLNQPWCYTDRTIYTYDFCDIPTCGNTYYYFLPMIDYFDDHCAVCSIFLSLLSFHKKGDI